MSRPSPFSHNRRAFLFHTAGLLTAVHAFKKPCLLASDTQSPMACAQIGTLHPHAPGKLEAMQNLPSQWRVVGVSEADEKRRASLANHPVFGKVPLVEEETLLAMPEVRAIAVETAIGDGTRAALRALRTGKHVHLDKPGGFSHAEFSEMRTEAEQRKLTLQMGYMLRYNPAFELLVRVAKEGWLGEITEIDCSMGKQLDARSRAQFNGQPGGAMFEIGGHLIDIIVRLLGKPAAVQAFNTPTQAGDFSDNQLAVLTYSKATACVRTNFADPFGGPRRRFNVTGTEGSFEIVPLESGQVNLSLSQARIGYKKGLQSLRLNVPKGRYDAEFVDLARAVRDGTALAWDAPHDIAVHETTLRAAGLWRHA
jgi:predicted dehydrogenase